MPSTRPPARALSFIVLLLSLATALPARSAAQATASVDPADPVYGIIDRLVWMGIVDTVIVGQKPWSRREIARLLAEASRNRARLEGRAGSARVTALLAQAITAYALELDALAEDRGRSWRMAATPERGTVDLTWADRGVRGIPHSGLGAIDAIVDPMLANRQGRAHPNTVTPRVEGAARAQLGRWASLSGAAQGWMHGPRDTLVADGRVDVLALATALRNVRIELGREYVSWGQGATGGLALSLNAPALDMLRVSNDLPFTMPWVLRRFGAVRGTIFVADLGADREYPHAKLVGWKVSVAPSRRVEFGVTSIVMTGGRGAPKATFGQRVADVIPVLDVLLGSDAEFLFSSKLAGADVRLRFPAARGLELHGEMLLDDFDARRLKSTLWEDNGVAAGFVLPRLTTDGRWRLWGDARHTGLRYYEHAQFTSGMTHRRRILGDPLGPRGDGIALALGFDPAVGTSWSLLVDAERRSGDEWAVSTTGPNDSGWSFVKTLDRPEEERVRLTVRWDRGLLRGVRLSGEAGVERVTDFAFTAGAHRTNALARLVLDFRP